MNRTSTVARYLLGLLFTVFFGLNGFLHFIPMPPPSSSLALQYLGAVSASHYIAVVFLFQLIRNYPVDIPSKKRDHWVWPD
ncbi:MAG: hypothetical protein WB992_03695 [Bryobacteraceae bacterium]